MKSARHGLRECGNREDRAEENEQKTKRENRQTRDESDWPSGDCTSACVCNAKPRSSTQWKLALGTNHAPHVAGIRITILPNLRSYVIAVVTNIYN